MVEERKIRVLVAKPGLDGHERGARVVAYGLRDEGNQVPETIAAIEVRKLTRRVGPARIRPAFRRLHLDPGVPGRAGFPAARIGMRRE